VAIAQNAKAFGSQFILKSHFSEMEFQIILSGQKIINMRTQHLHFIDSVLLAHAIM